GEAELAPQPGLARLDDLVATVRATGLDVETSVVGEPRPLPAAVDVSAYRLLQESLTNVMKHARASRVRVVVAHEADHLGIEVTDDGTGPAGESVTGRGLPGMRERVAVLGGSFEAGPSPTGPGFRVSARLPR
ncbi:MAG: sensor histidine kinase, partial [Nocardioides sp.]